MNCDFAKFTFSSFWARTIASGWNKPRGKQQCRKLTWQEKLADRKARRRAAPLHRTTTKTTMVLNVAWRGNVLSAQPEKMTKLFLSEFAGETAQNDSVDFEDPGQRR